MSYIVLLPFRHKIIGHMLYVIFTISCCLFILGANLNLLTSYNYLVKNTISLSTSVKYYLSRNGKTALYNTKGRYYISVDYVNQYMFNSNQPLKRRYPSPFTIRRENYGSTGEKYLLQVYVCVFICSRRIYSR